MKEKNNFPFGPYVLHNIISDKNKYTWHVILQLKNLETSCIQPRPSMEHVSTASSTDAEVGVTDFKMIVK